MRLLLDTCTFLWLFGRPEGLSDAARVVLADAANPVFLSPVTIWEILVKHGLGRLSLDTGGSRPEAFLVAQRMAHQIESLPVSEQAVIQLPKLPSVHQDPFDRLLICQAIEHGLTILTPDEHITRYPVSNYW